MFIFKFILYYIYIFNIYIIILTLSELEIDLGFSTTDMLLRQVIGIYAFLWKQNVLLNYTMI